MTDQHRLAKLYGVGGLPMPTFSEVLYWADHIAQLNIEITLREVFYLYKNAKEKENV